MPDNTAAIAALQAMLATPKTVTVDGLTTVRADDAEIRRRIAELQAEDTTGTYQAQRRNKISPYRI